MAKQAPEVTLANNPHAFIQCGPVAPEGKDDKRDLTIVTSAGANVVYSKSGNKTEVIPGQSGEICGADLDPSQKEVIAKAIVAPAGDIIILAENGNIRFKGKNIYFEAEGAADEDGEDGNIIATSNGQVIIKGGDHLRLAADDMCIAAGKSISVNGDIRLIGDIQGMESLSSIGLIKTLLGGNWLSVLSAVGNSCKR